MLSLDSGSIPLAFTQLFDFQSLMKPQSIGLIWPEGMSEGKAPFRDKNETLTQYRLRLCAEALMAWGNCSFEKPPVNFGHYMADLSEILGIDVVPDKISKYAKVLLEELKAEQEYETAL